MLNNNKGFTLLELLIALALLVILAGALYGTYFSVVSAREKGAARMDERRELSTTLGKLHSELACAFFKSSNSVSASSNSNSGGGSTAGRLVFKVEDKDSFGKPTSTLTFTAIRPPRVTAAPASDVILVQYAVKEEKDGVLTLTREQRDAYWDSNYRSTPYPVMESIDGFQVECYDGNKWVKSWDTAPTLNGRLPKAVRVTLTLKGGEVLTSIARVRTAQ
ncbi:MAG TPA: type II secretion system protein GspJ [Geomonas sp.]|nr:type II secretion system protein GspJ [Geomonas sp.]